MSKPRYLHNYQQSICDTFISSRGVGCVMQLPSLKKLVAVSSSSSSASSITVQGVLSLITGQRPKTLRAKKSIAAFNLRENDLISCVVTLRGTQLYKFLDLLSTFIMPKWDNIPATVKAGSLVRETVEIPSQNHTPKATETQLFKADTISFGQNQSFSFPQLEPYFSQFESTGGFHMNIVIDQKRCLHKMGTVIWGF